MFVFLAAAVMASGSADDWTLVASDSAGYFSPALGNGHTGVVMDPSGMRPCRVFQTSVYDEGRPGAVSTMRQVFAPLSLTVSVDGDRRMADWRQSLSLDKAELETCFTVGGVRVTATYKALRNMPHAVMARLSFEAADDAEVCVVNAPVAPKSLGNVGIEPVTIWCEAGGMKLMRATGSYNEGRDFIAASAIMSPASGIWTRTGSDTLLISMPKGTTASMWAVATQCSTADFSDPFNEADRQAVYAARQGADALDAAHYAAWRELWTSRIEIRYDDGATDSDRRLSLLVNSALYNLYSSVREGSRRSIPPMGLTSDKYYGHVFWDADTWILPVLAVLHPELARSMIDYRIDGLTAARQKAAAYGYSGAMFPWEADHHGEESTPTFALTGPLEHHITADVARAVWLYYCVTADTEWLRSDGYPLLRDCAAFWADRLSVAGVGMPERLSVKNVVGADEYAIGVDGDAFTDAAAMCALRYAADAADILGYEPDPVWRGSADHIWFVLMPESMVIKEHDDYNGEMTKQADVELLAYPLGVMTSPEQIKANIDYYSAKIDSVGGPAMSHAAMAVNYVRIGEPEKARVLIQRAVEPYLRGPFLSLSETPGNDETYFMTAAGGLLQAMIFGYCGVDITPGGLVRLPVHLPAPIKSVELHTTLPIHLGTYTETELIIGR